MFLLAFINIEAKSLDLDPFFNRSTVHNKANGFC